VVEGPLEQCPHARGIVLSVDEDRSRYRRAGVHERAHRQAGQQPRSGHGADQLERKGKGETNRKKPKGDLFLYLLRAANRARTARSNRPTKKSRALIAMRFSRRPMVRNNRQNLLIVPKTGKISRTLGRSALLLPNAIKREPTSGLDPLT
jgi:hypothetical protein